MKLGCIEPLPKPALLMRIRLISDEKSRLQGGEASAYPDGDIVEKTRALFTVSSAVVPKSCIGTNYTFAPILIKLASNGSPGTKRTVRKKPLLL
jgi:hypothetical protein